MLLGPRSHDGCIATASDPFLASITRAAVTCFATIRLTVTATEPTARSTTPATHSAPPAAAATTSVLRFHVGTCARDSSTSTSAVLPSHRHQCVLATISGTKLLFEGASRCVGRNGNRRRERPRDKQCGGLSACLLNNPRVRGRPNQQRRMALSFSLLSEEWH